MVQYCNVFLRQYFAFTLAYVARYFFKGTMCVINNVRGWRVPIEYRTLQTSSSHVYYILFYIVIYKRGKKEIVGSYLYSLDGTFVVINARNQSTICPPTLGYGMDV